MKIAIIGGGAAGMMSAATLLEIEKKMEEKNIHPEVFLFEKNPRLGAKVIISGGGRCNVTTGIADRKILLSKYVRGGQFLIPALNMFPPKKVYEWFENHGVPLKIESDNRVFPVSNNGKDIVGVFERLFSQHPEHIKTFLSTIVTDIQPYGQKISLTYQPKNSQTTTIIVDKVIITTGGNAYAHTGSSGDGYAFARKFGHTVTPLGPSLSSFECVEDWPKKLSGLSFQNARVEISTSEPGTAKKLFSEGPILFTHFGISGPAVFALSAYLAFIQLDSEHPLTLKIKLNTSDMFEQRNEALQKNFGETPAKKIISLLENFFPTRLAEQLLILTNISTDQKVSTITKEQRKALAHLLSGELCMTLKSRRAGDEFVTAGGVSLDEVNSKTMESKIFPGLYFAGEILDIDGVTGGFNLQSSRATGRLAAYRGECVLYPSRGFTSNREICCL